MNISGTYTSLQPVQVGNLVQLVLNRPGFVMQVYEKSMLDYEITNINNLVTTQLFDNYLITVRLAGVGNLVLELYTNSTLTWSQIVTTLQFTNISLVVGSTGIFLLFDSTGITHLPGVTISQSPITILAQFGFNSNLLAVATINQIINRSTVYDSVGQTIYLYGTSDIPLLINNSTIINRNSLYSFVISLSTSLIPINTLVAENITIDDTAIINGNIAFTETSGSTGISSTLNYVSTGNNGFSTSLGIFETSDIQLYNNFIAILGKDLFVNVWYVYQYAYNGTQIAKTTVSLPETIQEATLSYNGNRFIVYGISKLSGGEYVLSEFDIYDNIEVWTTPLPPGAINLTGLISEVSVSYPANNCPSNTCPVTITNCCSNTIRVYGKRLPYLVGAVSEVIWPNGTGTSGPSGCITGFSPCTMCPTSCTGCTGMPVCCANTLLPGCVVPYIVRVDFILTKAFSPVVAGQEYFLNLATNSITRDEILGRYIGTALDTQRVLMLSTGCLC